MLHLYIWISILNFNVISLMISCNNDKYQIRFVFSGNNRIWLIVTVSISQIQLLPLKTNQIPTMIFIPFKILKNMTSMLNHWRQQSNQIWNRRVEQTLNVDTFSFKWERNPAFSHCVFWTTPLFSLTHEKQVLSHVRFALGFGAAVELVQSRECLKSTEPHSQTCSDVLLGTAAQTASEHCMPDTVVL